MAEGKVQGEQTSTLPPKGQVKSVCQKWVVHEDGALAYVLQNKEIDHHLGLNRFHRRTVREDVPIARTAQEEEQIRLQEERLQQLEDLSRQAAIDELVAKNIAENLDKEEEDRIYGIKKSDEQYAREMQVREQKRYERHKEKRHERHLEKERATLEQRLVREGEEARLWAGNDSGSQSGGDTSFNSGDMDAPTKDLGGTRVTPGGVIEDEGDFSDFYLMPAPGMEPDQRRKLQEVQDQELAKLLQEQEHKRTKAEVDRTKLRDIEKGDEELAKIMQEQEKLRLIRRQQRKQQSLQDKDHRSSHQLRQMNSHPISTDSQRQPPSNSDVYHRTHSEGNDTRQAMEDWLRHGAEQRTSQSRSLLQERPDHHDLSSHAEQTSMNSINERSHRAADPSKHLSNKQPSIEDRSLRQRSNDRSHDPIDHYSRNVPTDRHKLPNSSDPHRSHYTPNNENLDYGMNDRVSDINSPHTLRGHDDSSLPPSTHRSAPVVTQNTSAVVPTSPSQTFNIAMAIDPTYHRRQHELGQSSAQIPSQPNHQQGQHVPNNPDIDWEPSLVPLKPGSSPPMQGTSPPLNDVYIDDDPSWQPVQGQRRVTDRPRGSQSKGSSKDGKKGSCKQQ